MTEDINLYLSDAIMERPYSFSVDYKKGKTTMSKRFYLYPMTLGKMFLFQRMISSLQINQRNLEIASSVEALRLVNSKKDACLSIITYGTCKDKYEVFDMDFVEKRKDFFSRNLSVEDMATLLLILLTQDKTSQFIKHIGLDKEQDRLSTVMNVKNKENRNNVTFGGLSQYGTLIDSACERYGWTKDYVVWGIDYSSLRLMLADKITSVYLSDDELKKVPRWAITSNSAKIKADDPKNKELIKSMSWK